MDGLVLDLEAAPFAGDQAGHGSAEVAGGLGDRLGLGGWGHREPGAAVGGEPGRLQRLQTVLAQPVQWGPVGDRGQQRSMHRRVDQLTGLQRRRHRRPPSQLPGRPGPDPASHRSPAGRAPRPRWSWSPAPPGSGTALGARPACQALVPVRLRVALGSTLMPGPIEVATVMPLM